MTSSSSAPARRRVALVGLGMAHKPHLAGLRDLSDRVEIGACFAPSAARRAAFSAANPDLPVVGSLEQVLADPSIDGVLILTPPNTHLELVERCAAAGKAVLLEKPLEISLARARRIVETMEAAKLPLQVMLQFRFRAVSRRLREVLASGELGEVVSASASVRWWRTPAYYAEPGRGMKARDGGGVLITQAIHTLDLFQSLAGPITRVAAMAVTSPLRQIDTEDIAAAAIGFANGAIGTIDATTVAYPGFPETIEIACARGTARLASQSLDIWWQDGRHERSGNDGGGGGGADPMAFSHEPHQAVIADWLDALDGGRAPTISGREALRVHTLIETMLESARSGRECAVPQE
ncbi:Gfo/Idh/MocA family oxidoreductase [uncultured Alsobacter sp.]|uniref:Gfo/Idh/MocA family protein n=1 Tax=uncultured Alsobacter sp. TaxID=1748258 RepID=UPI0025EF1651|nr:Gfo/Idh/MocA family oxidoreductase [uncultured Alsobacter sp.]